MRNNRPINLARSPFLVFALEYIREHAGCTKMAVITAYGRAGRSGGQYGLPSRTYANRNAAIGRLVRAGLVRDCGRFNRCELYAAAAIA